MTTQLEQAIRHEIMVHRLAAQIISENVNPTFVNISELTRRLLLDYAPDMNARDFEALRNRTQKQLTKELTAMWDTNTKQLEEFAQYEATYQSNAIAQLAEAKAALASVDAIAKRYGLPMVLTSGDTKTVGLWSEYVSGNIDATIKLVDSEIRAGRASGLGYNEIIGRVVGRKKADYADGLLTTKSRKWAENLVITGSSHYANAARDAVAKENDSILDGKVFSNVLDNRTTPQCLHYGQLAHQGKIYRLDDTTAPTIPVHFRCRSMWIYKVHGIDPFSGTRSAIQGKKGEDAAQAFEQKQANTDKKVTYKGRKSSDIFKAGQIDANISPQKFIERQPVWFQDSALGKTKAKLFREGGLPIDKFTDILGKPLTLKEMKSLDEYDVYFRKAGI